MPTLRDQIHQVADQLPPSATLEDAIERLVFLAKIDRGLAESQSGHLTPHDEVARRYAK
jgi:predicted transcriptional regulator